ncbi:hypothetical protein BGZ91_008461, partial [Linnemannia elongata]
AAGQGSKPGQKIYLKDWSMTVVLGTPWTGNYTVEQHITRSLFKGQNYSAPLDFSKQASHAAPHGQTDDDTETAMRNRDPVSSDMSNTDPVRLSSSVSSMATLDPQTAAPVLNKGNERSLVILSVGCGNTQWATEMALAHPQSAIHAINVSQISTLPAVPETTPSFDLDNLFFYNLDDNSLRVPFVSNSVDYIHVRRFLPNVSKAKYLAFLRELVRVLKAMLSGAEFDDLLERARQETRTLKSYQVFHVAVGRKTAAGGVRASACSNTIGLVHDESASSIVP